MSKFHEFLVNYQGFYKVFRAMPKIIFWAIFGASCFAGIIYASDIGEFGPVIGMPLLGAVAGGILALLHAISISPVIIITDSKIEKK